MLNRFMPKAVMPVRALVATLAFVCLSVFSSITIAADTIWIDVRSAEEFNAGHLTGAINIPHTDIAAQIAQVTTDKNADIALYCRSGRRSGLALVELEKLGYTNAHNKGGYEALKQQQASNPQH